MNALATDPGVFIRSMATRGNLGGLATATADVVRVLDAAGRDPVLVETVGVGQDEVDIVKLADISIVVLVPGMGDDVQALKAGIMEIGDIFVINKCDRPGVEKMERAIQALLSLDHRADGWVPPILKTVATEGRGIDELAEAIARGYEFLQNSPLHRNKKRKPKGTAAELTSGRTRTENGGRCVSGRSSRSGSRRNRTAREGTPYGGR